MSFGRVGGAVLGERRLFMVIVFGLRERRGMWLWWGCGGAFGFGSRRVCVGVARVEFVY